jgi:hypothetical protein
MSAFDAVDGSSTGIAMRHIRDVANVAYWHIADIDVDAAHFRS